jgi:hypothetical protein
MLISTDFIVLSGAQVLDGKHGDWESLRYIMAFSTLSRSLSILLKLFVMLLFCPPLPPSIPLLDSHLLLNRRLY